MQRLKPALAITIVLMNFVAASSTFASDLTTPEGAIAAYVEGVADQDFDAILAATAIDNMSDGLDFVAQVDRIKALTPSMPAPSSDPFFIAINKADFTDQIASQLKFLIYGLMTTNEVVDGKSVAMAAPAASDFVSIVRSDRLDAVELVKVGIPKPSLLNSERYQLNAGKLAKVYGADTSTERIALISFEGLNFAVGFTLLRYGDDWFIMNQYSPIAGSNPMGVPQRVTPDEYEKLLQ